MLRSPHTANPTAPRPLLRRLKGGLLLGGVALLGVTVFALGVRDTLGLASGGSNGAASLRAQQDIAPADAKGNPARDPGEHVLPHALDFRSDVDPLGGGGLEADAGVIGCADKCSNADHRAPAELHPVLGNTRNILLLGLDKNPGVRRGGLTDTLIIAALDNKKRRLGLVSVPRDLYVQVANHGETRINAVYAYAKRDKIDPTQAFDRVLRDTLGVPIHHTVVVDLGVFERVIDQLGGLDVEVPCPIRDRFIDARVEGGRRLLDVAAGKQHLDGATAAMYVRSRHGRSDWNRARRQQAVLLALRHKLSEPEVVLQLPQLLREWNDSVTTDLGPLQLVELAGQALKVKVENLHGVVLGHKETFPKRTEAQWSVLVPNNEAIAERLNDVYASAAPGEGQEVCPDADVALRRRAKAKDSQALRVSTEPPATP